MDRRPSSAGVGDAAAAGAELVNAFLTAGALPAIAIAGRHGAGIGKGLAGAQSVVGAVCQPKAGQARI